jgi:hypothetical protein
MRVDFPYVRERSSLFGVVTRPVAKITLQNRITQWMYIDSGADITLIPLSVGKLLGLRRTNRDRLQRIFGVGRSSVPILVKRLSVRLGPVHFRARVAWSQVEDVPLLLGRMDVFPRFDVAFKEKAGVTSFSSQSSQERKRAREFHRRLHRSEQAKENPDSLISLEEIS